MRGEDLEEIWGMRNLRDKEEIEPVAQQNLDNGDGDDDFKIEINLVQRGHDGAGGARS